MRVVGELTESITTTLRGTATDALHIKHDFGVLQAVLAHGGRYGIRVGGLGGALGVEQRSLRGNVVVALLRKNMHSE